jgi:hypothetical protein
MTENTIIFKFATLAITIFAFFVIGIETTILQKHSQTSDEISNIFMSIFLKAKILTNIGLLIAPLLCRTMFDIVKMDMVFERFAISSILMFCVVLIAKLFFFSSLIKPYQDIIDIETYFMVGTAICSSVAYCTYTECKATHITEILQEKERNNKKRW